MRVVHSLIGFVKVTDLSGPDVLFSTLYLPYFYASTIIIGNVNGRNAPTTICIKGFSEKQDVMGHGATKYTGATAR
jgi:hypothetical protein